ncbi:MAG: glycerol-3-phosphate 1-O-acyltransferase PlsY [Planctomycetota bacterium]
MPTLVHILVFLGAYALGSVSWALILVRLLRGEDLRRHGSGNLGATNAGRVLGRRWAVAIYGLDMLKGLVPVLVARALTPAGPPPLAVVAGLGAILGHVFPFYLRFRGGKGVATGSGVIVGLHPLTAGVGVAVWILGILATRYVSLASILATISLPIGYALLGPEGAPERPWVLGFLVAIATLVVWLHRSNVARLARGEERRIGGAK